MERRDALPSVTQETPSGTNVFVVNDDQSVTRSKTVGRAYLLPSGRLAVKLEGFLAGCLAFNVFLDSTPETLR